MDRENAVLCHTKGYITIENCLKFAELRITVGNLLSMQQNEGSDKFSWLLQALNILL